MSAVINLVSKNKLTQVTLGMGLLQTPYTNCIINSQCFFYCLFEILCLLGFFSFYLFDFCLKFEIKTNYSSG